MLKLSHLTPLAVAGRYRYCFVHPHDPTKCVKPLKPDTPPSGEISARKRLTIWYERYIRPPSKYKRSSRQSALEFSEYRRLAEVGDESVWRHVPRHFGFIETDMGPASVMERVCNYDGTVALHLGDRIRNAGLPEQALAEFRSFLRGCVLPHWSDPRTANVMCARIDASGRERLFIVDGLECGRRRLIRSRLSSAWCRRRARKCSDFFEKRLEEFIEQERERRL